jgi:glucose-6-phosphate 1-dehydrogenase
MIDRLLLFGATGDLAGRFLLPARAELNAERALSDTFQVIGAFRRRASRILWRTSPRWHADDLVGRLRYCRLDLGADDVTGAMRALLDGSRDGADARRPIGDR